MSTPERSSPVREVAVVIGVGGMGEAIARKQGGGRHLLLADLMRPPSCSVRRPRSSPAPTCSSTAA